MEQSKCIKKFSLGNFFDFISEICYLCWEKDLIEYEFDLKGKKRFKNGHCALKGVMKG